jgi:hypothetical protein
MALWLVAGYIFYWRMMVAFLCKGFVVWSYSLDFAQRFLIIRSGRLVDGKYPQYLKGSMTP